MRDIPKNGCGGDYCGRGFFFFLSLKAISRFRPFSLVGPTQAFPFSKKVMKKVFTHNLNTLSVYPAKQSNYTEVLGPLVRDFSIFFFGFFSFPTDRPKIRERIRQQTKKVNGLRGSTSKQYTINLVPRAFSMAWEGKSSTVYRNMQVNFHLLSSISKILLTVHNHELLVNHTTYFSTQLIVNTPQLEDNV